MNKSNLLTTRNKMKSKKPDFERQDVNIFKQFRGQWRKPKGIHSKLRRGFRGHKNIPSIGFSSPCEVKGLTRKGLLPFVVANVKDLEKVDTKINAIIIAHSVGMKKRVEILNKAKEKKIDVLGVKDVDKFLNEVKQKLESKKSEASKKKESKVKKIEEAQKVKKENKNEAKKDEPKK